MWTNKQTILVVNVADYFIYSSCKDAFTLLLYILYI
jgi:hypothetical protein